MYGCESWTINKVEHQRIDIFQLQCWDRLLRVPWKARSNQSILKEINPGYSLEGMMLKLKLQNFGHLILKNWILGKDSDAGKDWMQEEKGTTEDEMFGWNHWLDGHEFEQSLGVGDGQRSLACYSSWGHKELYATATAKSLQSCPTLCDPIDSSPPGSTVPGILQARTLEWAAIAFSKTAG